MISNAGLDEEVVALDTNALDKTFRLSFTSTGTLKRS